MLRSVENRVKWLLHELDSFEISNGKEIQENLGFLGSENERILGSYTNDPEKSKDVIIVTDLGLYCWNGDQWPFLDYKLMEEVRFPDGGKENWRSLIITFKSGLEFTLPVKNATKYKSEMMVGMMGLDVFAFRKFLIGIISGIKRAN